MCMTKKELENKINELRSLKALQQETADELRAIEVEIIDYMKENNLDTEITDTATNQSSPIIRRSENNMVVKELKTYRDFSILEVREGKSNVYIAYSQIDGHYETAQAYEDLIQKIDEYRMERKSSKFDNPMYNKGYEDGFADGANSIEE